MSQLASIALFLSLGISKKSLAPSSQDLPTPISGPVLKIHFHRLSLDALLATPTSEQPSPVEMSLHSGSPGGLGHLLRAQAFGAL